MKESKELKEKTYLLKLNSDYQVVTANDLIIGHQKMTLRESQLLSIAIAQVVKEDKDFKTYTTTVSELAAFMGIDENSLYRDLESICKNLMQRVVKVQIGGENATRHKKWKIYSWVDSASYDNGKLTLRLSEQIKPFVLELERYYSQTMLGTLMTFRSYHTTRLYQYLKAVYGEKSGNVDEWVFSCIDLRELFQAAEKNTKGEYKKYKQNRDLIKKTIQPALTELNASDYTFIYDYYEDKAPTRGNPLVGVRFKAIFFENDEFSTAKEKKEKFLAKYKPLIEEQQGFKIKPYGQERSDK